MIRLFHRLWHVCRKIHGIEFSIPMDIQSPAFRFKLDRCLRRPDQMYHYKRGCQRRVPTKVDLHLRGKPAQLICAFFSIRKAVSARLFSNPIFCIRSSEIPQSNRQTPAEFPRNHSSAKASITSYFICLSLSLLRSLDQKKPAAVFAWQPVFKKSFRQRMTRTRTIPSITPRAASVSSSIVSFVSITV